MFKVLNQYTSLDSGAYIWFVNSNSSWIKKISWKIGTGLLEKVRKENKENPKEHIIYPSNRDFVKYIVLSDNSDLSEVEKIWISLDKDQIQKVRFLGYENLISDIKNTFNSKADLITLGAEQV